MNRRIKKKVEKRHSGLLFDPFTGICSKPKTYRERKMNARILHGFIVTNNRSYYSEYDYRLKLRRSYRKGYEKAAIDKINKSKRKVFEPYLIGVDMCESADQKETQILS